MNNSTEKNNTRKTVNILKSLITNKTTTTPSTRGGGAYKHYNYNLVHKSLNTNTSLNQAGLFNALSIKSNKGVL